jgi:hypothetical protein
MAAPRVQHLTLDERRARGKEAGYRTPVTAHQGWAPAVPKSRYRHHGERVVRGQRMIQAASDIFLGWTRGFDVTRHFYWRQLRDMKGSAIVDRMSPTAMPF